MFAEGESELRDLVVQNLESCGFLNKIKAELRAGVFLALSEEGSLKKKVPLCNKKLDDYVNTSDGKLALAVVREFLEYFNLNFTLSVFDPEVSNSSPCANRKNLCEDLNLEPDFEGPVLSALLKKQATTKLSDLNPCTEKVENQDRNTKYSVNDKNKERSTRISFQINTKQDKDFFDEKSETDKSSKSDETSSFSMNKTGSGRNFFNFSKPEEKDIFKDQSIDHFFDDPVPLEKPNFLQLGGNTVLSDQKKLASEKDSTSVPSEPSIFLQSAKDITSEPNDQKKPFSLILQTDKESTNVPNDHKKLSSTFLSSEKRSLSSLRDLPSLTKQDSSRNKELLPITLESDVLAGASSNLDNFQEAKKDVDPESNEEYSDRQMNSEESIEEEIEEEEFSAGLDDLLNSSLSLGEDATSDQTISQTSVIEGIDHIESCNSVN